MQVNHAGQFVEHNGRIEYDGGQVDYFHYCHTDYMSLLELDNFADILGYEEKVTYKYRIGLPTHIEAYKDLVVDMDVLAMVSLVSRDKVVEMYMVVPIKPLASDFTCSKFEHVVISDDDNFTALKFKLGMVFPTAEDFRKAVKEQAILSKRDIHVVRNENHRVKVKCTGTCRWMMFASNICDLVFVTIKTINSKYTCGRNFEKMKYVNSACLAEKYVSKFEVDPKWKRASLNKDVRDDTCVDASIWKCYRARKRALGKI